MKLSMFFFLLLFSACSFAQKEHVITDNHVEARSVDPFDALVVSGPFTVHYSNGSAHQLAVSASDRNLRNRIVTKVVGRQLEISLEGSSWNKWNGKSNYIIYVSSPELHKIVASGAVDFDVHDQLMSCDLKLIFSGASDFSGDINVAKLDAVFSGGSDLKAKGKVDQLKLTMSGASDCNCLDLMVENAEMVASGASDIKISINKTIKATASGASDIEYRGSPSKVETKSWNGSVTPKGS